MKITVVLRFSIFHVKPLNYKLNLRPLISIEMVFIRKGNNFRGFIAVSGRKYTFDLMSKNSAEFSLEVDWRLKRDLGKSLETFLKDCKIFCNPEEFYQQFSVFVQNHLKPLKPIELWLQNPLKTSLLLQSLQQEIEKVGQYIKHFDLRNGVIKIEITDTQFRTHKADLKLDQNYRNMPISVVSHDLPQLRVGMELNPNFSNLFTVTEFCEKFSEIVTCFQQFWNTMSVIDSQCWVLDPASPTYKDVFRRIKISDTLSAVLTFNPFSPSQIPKIKLLGCQSDVNKYQDILQKNLEDDVWDNEEDLLFNISNILEVSLPNKIFMEEPKPSDLKEEGECAICFTWRLNKEIPSEVCGNSNCKSMYHSLCLFTYFSSVPRNRDYFGKIQGECPNCDCSISCTVPKLV